jgi:hypothetical protein
VRKELSRKRVGNAPALLFSEKGGGALSCACICHFKLDGHIEGPARGPRADRPELANPLATIPAEMLPRGPYPLTRQERTVGSIARTK